MPTVKELIDEYGERLVGARILLGSHSKEAVICGIDDRQKRMVVALNSTEKWNIHKETSVKLLDDPPAPIPTKTPFELLDLGFAGAMCDCWAEGVKNGRKPDDWQFLENTIAVRRQYGAKVMRHLRAYLKSDDDVESARHAAAMACDVNILWHIAGRGE